MEGGREGGRKGGQGERARRKGVGAGHGFPVQPVWQSHAVFSHLSCTFLSVYSHPERAEPRPSQMSTLLSASLSEPRAPMRMQPLRGGVCACVRAQLFQCHPTLCDPMDCSPPGSSVRGILPPRILKWVATPSSRGSCRPRNRTCVSYVSCIGRRVLYH